MSKINDFVIYDNFVETVLPNVFSDNFNNNVLIILAGLRDLGTLTSVLQISEFQYYSQLRQHLIKWHSENRQTAIQRAWSVIRPLSNLFIDSNVKHSLRDSGHFDEGNFTDDDPIIDDNNVLDALSKRSKYREINKRSVKYYVSPHPHPNASTSPVKHKVKKYNQAEKNKEFHKELKDQYYTNAASNNISVKIDVINHQQILDAMSVQRDDLLRRHDIYALGCFEKKKTVYTQQARALTLIHALFKAGKIAKGTKIGIVGGGISGIAAAIAAKKVGARVVVVEKEENLIPIQRDCSHRYLHPHAYDWPAAWCNENNSGLPIDELNWEAGTAKEVTETLEDKFKKFVNKSNETGDLKEITFYTCWPARMLLFDRVNKKHVLSKRAFDRDGENWRLFERDPSWSGVVDECTPISDEFRAEREQWKSAASKLIRRIRHGDISLPPPYLSPKGRNGINGQTPIFWNGQEHFTFKGKEISAKAFPDDDINPDFIVDCDILIFATGFGIEDPRDSILNDLKNHFGHKKEFDEIVEKRINKLPLKNNGYWEKDRINEEKSLTNTIHETDIKENTHDKPPKLYVVSGSGDGALIDILRLLILDFTGPEYHRDLLDKLNALLFPRQAVGVWLSQKDVLVYAEALRRLFNSDDFKRTEGETDRLSMIGRTMAGFDIDAFLDHFSINLADAEVYNVSIDPQPFWTPASVAHRLLVWCLHKKGRVRFVRGRVIRYADKRSAIQRTVTGKWRDVGNSAIVARHGVARQSEAFLRIQGVLINTTRTPGEVAADGRRLVSLLRLSDRLHPETEKFFRHTIKHLR